MANPIVLALIKNNVVVNRVVAQDTSFGDLSISQGVCDRYATDPCTDNTYDIGKTVP